MKKIIAFIVCAVMICTAAIGVCAADVRPTEVVAESGKHLVIKTGTAEMFSWDGLFQAGLQYGSIENGTLKLPKSDDRKRARLTGTTAIPSTPRHTSTLR